MVLALIMPLVMPSVSGYETSSFTECENGICTMDIHPYTFSINIDDDGVHGVNVSTIKNNCIKVSLYSLNDDLFEYGSDIPIKVDGIPVASVNIPSSAFLPLERQFCVINSQKILDHTYSFGYDSTTLNLSAEYNHMTGELFSTNKCADACGSTQEVDSSGAMEVGHGNTGSGLSIKYAVSIDTSSVPDAATILSSDLYNYFDYDSLQSGENVNVYNITYNAFSCSIWGTEEDMIGTIYTQGDGVSGWYSIPTATTEVNVTGNTQFYYTSDGATCDTNAVIANTVMDSYWPYLSITYEGGEPPAPEYCWGIEAGLLYADPTCVVYATSLLDVV